MRGQTVEGQIPILNTLRAVAAISVMLHHHLFTTRLELSAYHPLHIFVYGNQGVTIFFVISGFVIPYAMIRKGYRFSSVHRFLAKRLMRLEPPYLASLVLGVVFHHIRHLNPYGTGIDTRPDVETILWHLGYLIPWVGGKWIIGVYWSLAVEFQYYFFMAIAFLLVCHTKYWYRLLGYALVAYVSVGFIVRFNNNFLPSYLPLFLMGIVLCTYHVRRIARLELAGVLLLSLGLSWYCRGIETTIFALVTVLVILVFENYEHRYLNFFAKISYSLYLLHTITGDPFLNFVAPRFAPWVGEWILLPVAVGISTGAAYLMYCWVERPSMRLAARIAYVSTKNKKI
ncbi:MAG: acyltransferase family protein [Bernardetiaceae bacterium]